MSRPEPQLPPGNSSTWRGISENFAFHSCPESFIATRVTQWQQENPQGFASRTVVRAKVLNRNVAIVSSYKHIKAILDVTENGPQQEPRCVASLAYNELMAQFFPAPNLLLADGCPHAKMRDVWDSKMAAVQSDLQERSGSIIAAFVAETPLNIQLDLYEYVKTFAWRVLLGCFLDLRPDEPLFAVIQRLQEDLLRGQFSLMPISINTGFWRSPRTRGINARKSLQAKILDRLIWSNKTSKHVPFSVDNEDEVPQVVNHVLMMTSSLAAKGLASLLTAYLINLFLFQSDGKPLHHRVSQTHDGAERRTLLRSIYMETERMSPPIVGVVRRVSQDIVLQGNEGDTATLIPSVWDAWLYFVGAARETATFGGDSELFNPKRYLDHATPQPLGFGTGPKHCLGQNLIRDIIVSFAEQMLEQRIAILREVTNPGLKGWLGWTTTTPENWAKDIKQLPTQHPVDPIMVQFIKS